MARFENGAKWLMAALLGHHTSKNGLEILLSAKIGRNDRHGMDLALNIVVLKLRGVDWPGLRSPSGKYQISHWSLRTLQTRLIKIGAKVVRHARCTRFQMAEVAIPKNLFAAILRRIRRLMQPVPA